MTPPTSSKTSVARSGRPQVPAVVQQTRLALRQNKCVVIGLLGTGEARATATREEFGDSFDDFVSAPLATLQLFIQRAFPPRAGHQNRRGVLPRWPLSNDPRPARETPGAGSTCLRKKPRTSTARRRSGRPTRSARRVWTRTRSTSSPRRRACASRPRAGVEHLSVSRRERRNPFRPDFRGQRSRLDVRGLGTLGAVLESTNCSKRGADRR